MNYVHTVYWANPYTSPPKNMPRALLRVVNNIRCLEGRLRDKFYRVIDRQDQLGIYGYSLGWEFIEDPDKVQRRKWSDERKFAHRLKLLEKRVKKAYSIPQLYEAELQRRISEKPEYFGFLGEKSSKTIEIL